MMHPEFFLSFAMSLCQNSFIAVLSNTSYTTESDEKNHAFILILWTVIFFFQKPPQKNDPAGVTTRSIHPSEALSLWKYERNMFPFALLDRISVAMKSSSRWYTGHLLPVTLLLPVCAPLWFPVMQPEGLQSGLKIVLWDTSTDSQSGVVVDKRPLRQQQGHRHKQLKSPTASQSHRENSQSIRSSPDLIKCFQTHQFRSLSVSSNCCVMMVLY